MGYSHRPNRFRIGWYGMPLIAALLASCPVRAATVGGDVTYTTDYLFRGISESDGRSALQLDLHAMSGEGTFAGVFASTLNVVDNVGPRYEFEAYLGHRFNLSQTWSTTVAAVNYAYLHGSTPFSNDYQEISLAVSYLDRWTLSVAAAPNAVRYLYGSRLGRYPSYVTDASGQLPLIGPVFLTSGVGYYLLEGPGGAGYVYGNAGLAVQYRSWRLDAGYYFTEARALQLFPYQRIQNRFAATLSWHF